MAILDFSMEGVKPQGEYAELPEGEYLVRVDNEEKKPVTDKFYDDGSPSETNGKHAYLNLALQVYGGPNDGQIEFDRLNLWNTKKTTVNIARSTLKSIQDATGMTAIYDADPDYSTPKPDGTGYKKDRNSAHLVGRYMLMKVKKNLKGELKKHYDTPPEEMVKAIESAVQQAPATVVAAHTGTAQATARPAPVANPEAAHAKPSWATKK